ncbi:MAG: hypothetical protein ACREOO_24795 [bacterium]
MKPKHAVVFANLAVIISIALLLTGCSADSPLGILFSPPKCTIIGILKRDATGGGTAKIAMTVENVGDGATAYNVGCGIKLKRGNTIIESSSAIFGTLRAGEAAIDEVWFSRIEKHNEYHLAEYTLYWYDAEDGYYEE